MNPTTNILDAFADIMLYPDDGHRRKVQRCIDLLDRDSPDVRRNLVDYLSRIDGYSLSQQEELYIQTFDLNKTATLDLGWHLFGEDYNRGLFLVKLRQLLQILQIPETRELPDHLTQVLRVLGRQSPAEADQFAYACVIPALETVCRGVPQDNPLHLLVHGLIQLLSGRFDIPDNFDEELSFDRESRYAPLPIIH